MFPPFHKEKALLEYMALLASLRSTIAYQTTGSTISTGAIYTVLAGNVPAWTNQLTYSTLTGSTISTNSIATASTLTGSSIILSGNVGIGTASPSQILEVYRNSGVGTVTQMNITSWAGVATTTNQSILNLRIQGAGGGSVDNIIIGQYYSSGTGTYGISFNPNNGVNVMNILGSGRVGIGTTDPATTLHVSGASSTYTNGQLFISDANYPGNQLRLFSYWGIQISTSFATIQSMYDTTPNRLAINPNGGYVGIGTTNPTNLVTVQNGVLEVNDGTTSGKYGIYSYNGGLNINPRTSSGGYNDIVGLCMNSSGKVGIGLTNAETALDVNGTIIIRGANSMTFAYGSVNSIYATTYDGYTPASLNNNLIIKSWHGIAFATHDNSVRVTIDTRTGNANFSGSITAGVFLGDGLPIPFWSTFVNGWYIKNPNTHKITIYGTAISSDWSYIYLNLWDLTGIRTIAYPFDEYNFVSTFQRVAIGFAPPINNANEVRIDSNQGNASKYGITFIIKASY